MILKKILFPVAFIFFISFGLLFNLSKAQAQPFDYCKFETKEGAQCPAAGYAGNQSPYDAKNCSGTAAANQVCCCTKKPESGENPLPPGPKEVIPPVLSVAIPGLGNFSKVDCSEESGTCQIPWLAEYIGALYKYSLVIIGLLAVIVMMIGGVRWLTAGGAREAITDAMNWIRSGLLGITLMVCSYLLLFIINPNLTLLQPINISYLERRDLETLTIAEQISAQNISAPIGNTVFGEGTNGVPLIMQCREPAKSIKYGLTGGKKCSTTLCSSGCGAASVSMVIFYHQKENDLNKIVSELERNGGRNGCDGGTTQSGLKKVAEKYGLKVTQDNSGFDWAAEKAKTCPVTISVWEKTGACPFTNAKHFIVITGNNNGTLSINDPAHGGSTITLADLKSKCTYGTGASQICK